MTHDPPSKIAAGFKRQIAWDAIHAAADARGGMPTDQVLAAVREFLRQKHMIAIDAMRVNFALSAIATGLDAIERGKTQDGMKAARDGVEFIRSKIAEAQS